VSDKTYSSADESSGPDPEKAGVELRLMTSGDIADGMRLKRASGWDQTRTDWRTFLALRPNGCFVAVKSGRIVGTVTTIDYQGVFSWIGMLLVDPEHRRKGIGRALLARAMQSLSGCRTIKLDATPQGRKVYEKLGFREEWELVRMLRGPLSPAPTIPAEAHVRSMTESDLEKVVEFDAPVFGQSRGHVLKACLANSPQYGFLADTDGVIEGYCLGRSGEDYEHIGPVVCRNRKQAEALSLAALVKSGDRPIALDVPIHAAGRLRFLESLGFSGQRRLTRMFLGPNENPGLPQFQWAICAPELG